MSISGQPDRAAYNALSAPGQRRRRPALSPPHPFDPEQASYAASETARARLSAKDSRGSIVRSVQVRRMTQRGLIDTEPATDDKRGTELTVMIAEHVYTNIVE